MKCLVIPLAGQDYGRGNQYTVEKSLSSAFSKIEFYETADRGFPAAKGWMPLGIAQLDDTEFEFFILYHFANFKANVYKIRVTQDEARKVYVS